MLSRIASSLFWIGRYIERSDGTARILGFNERDRIMERQSLSCCGCHSRAAVIRS